ncbi:carotenoid ester lipase precursor [Dendrothele bispora CBS 962.96]|uniref:Carboxylic ester hydrolase n=1 Tax=Dendrothele bispora (strain CBS 962.96) TaxID=1314807 RepID=A0A4S8LEE3_DENBC|nr:carotenoid ester lipase precursor [Dendrothele bispora CBS 962.96]
MYLGLLAFVLSHASLITAAPLAGPSVTLDSATVTGTTLLGVDKFLGIPFAEPPTGNNRFRLPVPIPAYTTSFSATAMGPACPQQAIDLPLLSGIPADVTDFIVNTAFGVIFPDDEDCLTINVVRPAGTAPGAKLPVVAWIFGGGFELGSPQMYDGATIVSRSIQLGEPVIYVSMNYRVTAFGFLASQEVKDAGVGNLGLQDQREALRWVQKYIGAFGGDPTKVTIWGESAGAISVSLQMLANGGDTEGLFRAGFMQSGSPIPVGDITNGQPYYDALVQQTGCSGSADTLQCLREVPYATLKAAVDASPGIFSFQSLKLAWLPRADGVFLTDHPQKLVQQGKIAKIPIISGDCDDEGTLFSISTLNVTTNAQVRDYMKTVFLPSISNSDLDDLLTAYPQDITQGSPFDTGILNAVSPQFKRFASFQGDAVFQAPRRFFFENLDGKQPIWAFLSKRLKGTPILGSFHASDILNVYGGGGMADYLIRFATNLDPNGNTGISWPQYSQVSPTLLTFIDGLIPQILTQDNYRVDAMKTITQVLLTNPV